MDEQSVGTHKLQESTGQFPLGLADLSTKNAVNAAQLHVGASYTFYNEQSNSKLQNRDAEATRAKAASQLEQLK